MEEEFYSTVKLTSGEELIAKICYLTEENCILLDRPMLVEKIKQKKHGKEIEGFILKDWISSTYETMFIVKMDQIITLVELDDRIKRFYLKSLEEEPDTPKVSPGNLTKKMGYLGSVNETKKFLEDIYKKS